jgi:hypothetical protein
MRKMIQVFALLLAVVVVCIWLLSGRNTGWTKNKVFEPVHDPVTGIDGSVEVKKFIPGIDFLGIGLGLAALQFGSSFIVRKDK